MFGLKTNKKLREELAHVRRLNDLLRGQLDGMNAALNDAMDRLRENNRTLVKAR